MAVEFFKAKVPSQQLDIAGDPGSQVVTMMEPVFDITNPTSVTYTWNSTGRAHYISRDVGIMGFSNSAELSAGTTPDNNMAGGVTLEINCFTGGTCDPKTLYLQDLKSDAKYRVVVLPLGGNVQVLREW